MRAIEFLTEGDKMSNINLDQALANTPPVWKKFISSLPPQLAREFVDERPVPNQEDIDWFTPLRLKSPQPVAVSVADLLRHPENQGSIGRSPDDVIDAVNQRWGLKIPSGKKYDPNPARYRAYAQMTPGTASPSVAVDGVIIFGAGRFVAAALRGDKTMRVWDMTREQGVAEGFSNDMSTKDMIAYLRQHHDTNLHQDYLNHLNTFSKFVLKDIPTNTLKTDLPGLDREKVERYKKMDQSKAPPIVLGGKYILDGYHRANAVKEMGIPTIKAYVGITTK